MNRRKFLSKSTAGLLTISQAFILPRNVSGNLVLQSAPDHFDHRTNSPSLHRPPVAQLEPRVPRIENIWSEGPVPVGRRKQLLVDDYLISHRWIRTKPIQPTNIRGHTVLAHEDAGPVGRGHRVSTRCGPSGVGSSGRTTPGNAPAARKHDRVLVGHVRVGGLVAAGGRPSRAAALVRGAAPTRRTRRCSRPATRLTVRHALAPPPPEPAAELCRSGSSRQGCESREVKVFLPLIALATSRDGDNWDLTWVYANKTFLPRGQDGSYDKDYLIPSANIVTHTDKHWLYYAGGDERNSSYGRLAIGLATLRLDGFCYLEPWVKRDLAWVITKPFKLEGTKLELNVGAKEGDTFVEVLDADTAVPIPGYTKEQATGYRDQTSQPGRFLKKTAILSAALGVDFTPSPAAGRQSKRMGTSRTSSPAKTAGIYGLVITKVQTSDLP